MYQSVELLIPLAGIAMVFGIVYLGVSSENRKNLAMIEAGMNPNEKKGSKRHNLKNALLLIFIPLGYLIAKKYGIFGGYSGLLGAFLFGGIALLIFYIVETILDKKQISED